MWAWHSSQCGYNAPPAWNMHTKFILVNCEQATNASSTGDLQNMGHRHDATHKVLLVKCEEVPGDLKNNMGNVYMWPSEFARMWKRVSDFWSVMWGHFNNGFACNMLHATSINKHYLLSSIGFTYWGRHCKERFPFLPSFFPSTLWTTGQRH